VEYNKRVESVFEVIAAPSIGTFRMLTGLAVLGAPSWSKLLRHETSVLR
jgi:hypothetical protein